MRNPSSWSYNENDIQFEITHRNASDVGNLVSNRRAKSDFISFVFAQVCEEERCQREVFPLAMNLLDRFLAVVRIRKTQLQLLGSVCLFIASKLRQSRPISPKALVQYTDWSITLEELTVS